MANAVQICNAQELEDLRVTGLNLDLVANTNATVQINSENAVTGFVFRNRVNVGLVNYNANGEEIDETGAVVTDGSKFNNCGYDITCADGTTFTVGEVEYQKIQTALQNCTIATMGERASAIQDLLTSGIQAWDDGEAKKLFKVKDESYLAYTPEADETTIYDIISGMVADLEEKGYPRSVINIDLSPKMAMEYEKLYGKCCQLKGERVEVYSNPWGVQAVTNKLQYGDADIYVYVKEYTLFGRFCVETPLAEEGTNNFRGMMILTGREGIATGVVDPSTTTGQTIESALKYTVA